MTKLLTRKNTRLKDYNYSDNGWYFVTICSKGREKIFGEHNENTVGEGLAPSRYRNHKTPNRVRYKNNIKLSKIGEIIDKQWIDIPNQYNNVKLDEYIIMPNHIYGILRLSGGGKPLPYNICYRWFV